MGLGITGSVSGAKLGGGPSSASLGGGSSGGSDGGTTIINRKATWQDLGIWVGSTAPQLACTFAQWLANPAAGYWGWIDLSVLSADKQVAAAFADMLLHAGVPSVLVQSIGSVLISAPAGAIPVTAVAPQDVRLVQSLSAPAAAIQITATAPVTTFGPKIAAAAASVVVTATAPGVVVSSGVSVSPPGASLALTATAPSTSTGGTFTPVNYSAPALDAGWCADFDVNYPGSPTLNTLQLFNDGDSDVISGVVFAVPSDPGAPASVVLHLKASAPFANVTIRGRKVTNQGIWSAGTPPGTPYTTAAVTWSGSAGAVTSPNILSIWNELVGQAGWTWGTSKIAIELEGPDGTNVTFSSANAAVPSGDRPLLALS